jgi:competence protein ComEC
VLDVGQGLAIVLELPEKLLVYDTGPAYSQQFDAGSGIVAPFLRYRGRSSVDKLLISHEDGDHAGGFYGLVNSIDIQQVVAGPGFFSLYQAAPDTTDKVMKNIQQCDQSQRWSWLYWNRRRKIYEPIYFSVLMPDRELSPFQSANNNSCVLLIRWREQRILLTGDIEKEAEQALLRDYQLQPVTLMTAPHHGSKTSSSQAFVDQLKPQYIVFSAGYRHQYGHPHRSVVNRYREVGSQLWNTAQHGAITFTWHSDKQLQISHSRSIESKYWWR